MDKLLPCPFCGGEAETFEASEDSFSVLCTGCGVETPYLPYLTEAIAAWNRRVDDERLKTALKEIVQLAIESIEREKTLARLEAEVMAAIDAAPVVRGEWVVTDAYPHRVCCSLCYKTNVPNEEWLFEKNEYPHFCMWCGAKMESEGSK